MAINLFFALVLSLFFAFLLAFFLAILLVFRFTVRSSLKESVNVVRNICKKVLTRLTIYHFLVSLENV